MTSTTSSLTQVGSQVSGIDQAEVEAFCILGVNMPGEVKLGKGCHLRSHTVIYGHVTLGEKVHVGHGVLIREHTTIGNQVSIGSHCLIEHHVQIADHVRIHSNVFVPEHTIIETGAWIGPQVVFTNARYPGSARTKEFLSGVRVGAKAKIGAGSIILPGVQIGAGAVIGAGSVVTKDVPAETVVVGHPARFVRSVLELTYPDGMPVYERINENSDF